MGGVISKAANGLGIVLGDAFVAPIKTLFGASCDFWKQFVLLTVNFFVVECSLQPYRGICSGTWDIICFLEHLCLSSLVKLLMVLGLTYITFLFFYLLFKVGIVQCIGRNLCKMSWAACHAYWSALEGICSFLWHKLKNTKRVHRHRFHDIEEGYSSSEEGGSKYDYGSSRIIRRREFARERRKDRMRRSLYPRRRSWKSRKYGSSSHHHVRLKTSEVSLHLRDSRRLHNPKNHLPRNRQLIVRQRIR